MDHMEQEKGPIQTIPPRRKPTKYPCINCKKRCTAFPRCIECSSCLNWIHRQCVPLSEDLFVQWTANGMDFVCSSCAFARDGTYDNSAALKRLSTVIMSNSLSKAKSEKLLMVTYGVELPSGSPINPLTVTDDDIDDVAKKVLQMFHPVILSSYVPISIQGDGNCLFRALSRGLFGNEDHHKHIRMLTALEIIDNRNCYDTEAENFIDYFKDDRLVFDLYETLLYDVTRLGGYCGMLILSAASAALKISIQSYCPPTCPKGSWFLSEPLSRKVTGRGVSLSKDPAVTLMWSTSYVPQNVKDFRPNHFVLLCDKRCDIMIDLNDDAGENIGKGYYDNDTSGKDDKIGRDDDDENENDDDGDDIVVNDNGQDVDVDDYNDDDDDDDDENENDDDDDIVVNDNDQDVDVDDYNDDDDDDDDENENDDDDDIVVNNNDQDVDVDDYNDDDDEDDDGGDIVINDQDVDVDDYDYDDDDENDDGGDIVVNDNDQNVDVDGYNDDDNEEEDLDVYDDDYLDVNDDDDVNDDNDLDDLGGDRMITEVLSRKLPHGKFLENDKVVEILINSQECLQELPIGAKNDVYFIVNNEANVKRRAEGKEMQYWDDRGAWLNGHGSKVYLWKRDKCRIVYLRNQKYTILKNVKKQTWYEEIDPQPHPDDIVILNRYYTKHKEKKEYQKRVNTIVNNESFVALYEFRGTFGTPSNAEGGSAYQRLKPSVMQKLKADCQNKTATDIYSQADLFAGPHNKRQIYNAKASVYYTTGQKSHKANFADQVAAAEELQQQMPFIRRIVRQHGKVPCIILYKEEQINDLRRFCCPPHSAMSTVLGVDKTFNLSDVHVTVTVYKNLAVKRKRNEEHPVFPGPLLLHGNSDTETFLVFFEHLASLLSGCPQSPVLGSDEEKAMRVAMKKAFPNSPRLVCCQHLKKNLKNALLNIGLPQKEQASILKEIFGEHGILERAVDPIDVKDRLEHLADSQPPAIRKIILRLASSLEQNAIAYQRPGLNIENVKWTNNNAESQNHKLKQMTQWKSLKLVDLIIKLHELVSMEFRELSRAMCGLGEFSLTNEYKQFYVPRDKWFALHEKKRNRHMHIFSLALNESVVRSTNRVKVALESKMKGKKNGQRKRKASAKTMTPSKKRTHTNSDH